MVEIEDDDDVNFEADFQEFNDDEEEEEDFDELHVFVAKPPSFPSKPAPSKGINVSLMLSFFLLCYGTIVAKIGFWVALCLILD